MSSLPDIIDKVYSFKIRNKTGTLYPVSKNNLDSKNYQNLPSTSEQLKRTQLSHSQTKLKSTQPARFYKPEKQMKGESMLAKNLEKDLESATRLLMDQESSMRIVMDNMSKNVIIYMPTDSSKNKFKPPKYPDKLKHLDNQIVKCQKALTLAQQIEGDNEPYSQPNEFDFLTGVGIQGQVPDEEKEEVSNQELEVPRFNTVKKAYNEIYEQYQNEISKAFLHKEKQIRKARKRKVALKITTLSNQLSKTGLADATEHQMRVYNKEHIPCKPAVLVPSFVSKKDNIANNVIAYLKDYKPLLTGQRNNIPKSIQSLLEIELEMLKHQQVNPRDNSAQGTEEMQLVGNYLGNTKLTNQQN